MSKSPSPFGRRLRALREWVRISPEELSERCGGKPHAVAIRKLESGVNTEPRLSTITRLAKGLGVEVVRLLEDSPKSS